MSTAKVTPQQQQQLTQGDVVPSQMTSHDVHRQQQEQALLREENNQLKQEIAQLKKQDKAPAMTRSDVATTPVLMNDDVAALLLEKQSMADQLTKLRARVQQLESLPSTASHTSRALMMPDDVIAVSEQASTTSSVVPTPATSSATINLDNDMAELKAELYAKDKQLAQLRAQAAAAPVHPTSSTGDAPQQQQISQLRAQYDAEIKELKAELYDVMRQRSSSSGSVLRPRASEAAPVAVSHVSNAELSAELAKRYVY